MPDVGSLLAQAFVVLVSGAAGAWLSHRLSRARFGMERLWDLRLKAYSEILHSLTRCQHGFERAAELLAEEGERCWNEKSFIDLCDEAADFLHEARKLYSTESLALTVEFDSRFSKLLDDLERLRWEDLLPPEDYKRTAALVEAAVSDLRMVARRDLRP